MKHSPQQTLVIFEREPDISAVQTFQATGLHLTTCFYGDSIAQDSFDKLVFMPVSSMLVAYNPSIREFWGIQIRDALQDGKSVYFIQNKYETTKTNYALYSNTYIWWLLVSDPTNHTEVISNQTHKIVGKKTAYAYTEYLNLPCNLDITFNPAIMDTNYSIYARGEKKILGGRIISELSENIFVLPDFNIDKTTGADFERAITLIERKKMPAVRPAWFNEEDFNFAKLQEEQSNIQKIENEIANLEIKRSEALTKTDDLKNFYNLLYGTGEPLENSVRETLKLMGFEAKVIKEGEIEGIDTEIDAAFEIDGQHFIGEAEGKVNKPLDKGKAQQLHLSVTTYTTEMGLDPDVVTGVLFGCAPTNIAPNERSEVFSSWIMTAARRISILVNTVDMYPASTYLLENPTDEAYKLACRKAFTETPMGKLVVFPSVPTKTK